MTTEQQTHFENEILRAALIAQREENASRLRLSAIGQQLQSLGRALQQHPEEVTPLPEPQSVYDYREPLNALDRKRVVDLCAELRSLGQAVKAAEQRKAMLTYGPFSSRDSGV
jgi:hypothetical protein